MTRRRFLRSLGAAGTFAVVGSVLAGCAGNGGPTRLARVPHVGFLDSAPLPASLADFPFSQGLRQLGYVEGKTIVVDYRFTDGDNEVLALRARELVQANVDVLVTNSPSTSQAAKEATATIPIVIASGTDPVALGFAANYANPSGNVTGNNAVSAASVQGKRLELLKQAVPSISVVGVLYGATGIGPGALEATQAAAPALGLKVVPMQVTGRARTGDFEAAFRSAAAARADGLVVAGNVYIEIASDLVALAAANRLASIAQFREWADAGGLMAYGPNVDELVRHAATFVDKILKGAKAGDLPIEEPTKFDFIVNLKAARALGLTIPSSVLAQATEVIQ